MNPHRRKNFGAEMGTLGKFQAEYNSKLFIKQVLLEALQVQFKYGTYPNVQISSSKVPMHTG